MKLLKLSLLLFFYLLLFQSCKKDLFEVEPDTSVSRSLVVSRSFEDRDEDLVLDFYTDILELQTQTRFYDEFHQEYGFFNWSSSIEMQSSEGKLLIVPTQHDFRTPTTGQFLYFDSGTEQKMRFYSRAEIDNKIAQENVTPLTKEEVFVYRVFVANDLRNVENTEDVMATINPEVIFRDGDDIQATEDCEGGSYEWVCVYHQGADLSIGINVEDYITTNDPRIRAYDGHSLQDLEDNYDNIVNGNGPGAGTGPGSIPWDLKPEFDQYLEDRRNLYNLHGIGNGPEGILEGTVIEFIRECNWVWVWCWQDPADYGSILTGGGNSSSSSDSYLPAWQDNYNDLRFCEGVGDVQDTGQDNVNAIHPNFDFCSTWMDYLIDCILPNQSEMDTYEETIWQWAQFQYTNSDLFNQTIADPNNCTPTDQIDLNGSTSEECISALDAFQTAIGKTLNKFEKWAILNPTDQTSMPCADQGAFNVWALNELLGYNYNVSLPQSIQDEALNASDFTSTLAYKVFSFLEDHDDESSDNKFLINQILSLDEQYLSQNLKKEFVDALDLFFDAPDNLQSLDNFIDFLDLKNINGLAVFEENVVQDYDFAPDSDWPGSWENYTPSKIWSIAGPIKTALKNAYPNQKSKIDNFFACRVLGPALEKAVLGSLNIPKNNSALPISGKIPDGLAYTGLLDPLFPNNSVPNIPRIVEVKGRFSVSPNANFDYSNQMAQFQGYLQDLTQYNPVSQSIVLHSLTLILPSGILIDEENIINQCTANNVPIFTSNIEVDTGNPNEIFVNRIMLLNDIGELDRSGHLFSFLPDNVFEHLLEKHHSGSLNMNPPFDYDSFIIDFQEAANAFEISYLIPNQTPNDDDCED